MNGNLLGCGSPRTLLEGKRVENTKDNTPTDPKHRAREKSFWELNIHSEIILVSNYFF